VGGQVRYLNGMEVVTAMSQDYYKLPSNNKGLSNPVGPGGKHKCLGVHRSLT
jgi:hypothetical protein